MVHPGTPLSWSIHITYPHEPPTNPNFILHQHASPLWSTNPSSCSSHTLHPHAPPTNLTLTHPHFTPTCTTHINHPQALTTFPDLMLHPYTPPSCSTNIHTLMHSLRYNNWINSLKMLPY
ncbi:hypothetical protein DPMN_153860 [Dreissena polymorpha]|uniref:Uncharacterized protein n=1 Tax=Dreissena polymorpha TaxID=45954 RepID=A0A9D4FJC4_DREPO|nr:hypothetical protein DPMN_153860 [Dreissena polymorpha]